MRKIRYIYDTNRTMTQRPRRVKGWCYGCDLIIVEDGKKCPACNNRIKVSRDKKINNDETEILE